ncbi:MAG: CpsD/CapB family tyrosine-protein kinase, partial [Pygmaiobacter sp.]
LNLAITLGEADKKILIVDCDLRKPVLHKYLHLSRKTNGLTTVLSGKCTLDSAIVIFKDIKIDVLTAGAIPPNPTEILASEKMEKLVTELSKRYDYIIFDTPPVSVVTDAAVLGRLADGALLVIRQKFATSEAVRAAKQNLESVGVHVIGAVLSRFDYKTLSKDRGYYANYEYNYVQHAGTDS